MSIVQIERKVLAKNDTIANENRELFNQKKVFVLNMVSSPGSGKTSLIERTLKLLKQNYKVAVIEGDVQTDLDARRIERYDVPVAQIITNGGCHLEAHLVKDAALQLNLTDVDLLVIENVGNLVCPASFDLGENLKVILLSVTEGEDKPLKYPLMFRNSAVLVINKIDLLPYLNFNLKELIYNAQKINPSLKIFTVSCKTGEGFEGWYSWLESSLIKK